MSKDIFAMLRQQEASFSETTVGSKKVRKFLKVAIPILVAEIVAIIALVTYLILLPKNYCRISTNMKSAVVYVNDKKTDKFRFTVPKEKQTNYYFGVQISIYIPGDSTYLVTYTVDCEKYHTSVSTSANVNHGVYTMQVEGGKRTALLTGITIKSDQLINNFDVDIDVNISKLT